MKKIFAATFILLACVGLLTAAGQGPDSERVQETDVTAVEADEADSSGYYITDDGDGVSEVITVGKVVDLPVSDPVVYIFPIRESIMPATVRLVDKCIRESREVGADYIIIDMNTYGGLVDAADSIRTRILNHDKPIYMFVNNQAASAGALISIAADRIYMREGASMGAATVVDQTGAQVPDKYQSFMRGMMRSTAEAHGKVVDRIERGDTMWRWYRDPRIAEAMVDPSVVVPGLIGEDKVLTFSTEEAIQWHYCEGKASSIEQVLAEAGIVNPTIYEYEATRTDKLMGFLTNPAFQGILIMLIIGGIYFELQTPGIGFPLAVSVAASLLYFAPLYIEGMLANWEVIVFILGIILILVEIFVTPGFGVLGIAGVVAIIIGLSFAMVDTELLKYIPDGQIPAGYIVRPVALVIIAVTASLIISIALGKRLLTTGSAVGRRVVLASEMTAEEGYVSREKDRGLVGRFGITTVPLRPSGKVLIDDRIYEAAGAHGMFIEKGREVEIIRDEGGVLYCRPV
ncbi:MAG: nodulation protein NfeD [Rikenellaceae bacterium]|nr:nodulation protein NfeD [Rikenellaceae bacterium]